MRDIKINRNPIFLSRCFSVSFSCLVGALPRCVPLWLSGKVDYCDAGDELEAMELRELPPKPV
jgi:hypothetical protein